MTRPRCSASKSLPGANLRKGILLAALIFSTTAAGAQTLTLAPEELETNFTGRAFDPLVAPDQLESILNSGTKLVTPETTRPVPASLEGTNPQTGRGTSGAEDAERQQFGLGSSDD